MSIAELAVQKFVNANMNYIMNVSVDSGKFMLERIAIHRPQGLKEFDWFVLGIGGKESGSLTAHLATVQHDEEVQARTVGDIMSRLFDASGNELDEGKCNQFVQLSLKDLSDMARRGNRRVLVIAGGRNKVEPIAVILRKNPRLINFLITDELTARMLIRDLRFAGSEGPEYEVSDS